MSGSKHIGKLAWLITGLMVTITILFMAGLIPGIHAAARNMGYEERLFDQSSVHTIDIIMNDWETFVANAASEEYETADLVIDGETFRTVGIRGKGNTSLSSVSAMDSDRYSFKVEFDHYDSSLKYYGLDKLSLNNLIQDSTMMKDYLTYTMMGQFGAAAPLCSFVYLTVNGEDWGLYLAVEGIEDSFLQRNYGSDYGELYKPDSMSFGGGRGNGKDFSMDDFMNAEGEQSDGTARPERGAMPGGMPAGEEFDPSAMFGGQMPAQFDDAASGQTGERPSFGGGFGGMGSSDVKLQYIDDDPASYSNIWNNAKTQVSDADQERLIGSLKLLSEGKEIETVVDVERVLRYFVVHNFVCNGDSYTGAMIHNYYLYEDQGMLSMIPWDYNLGFGTFQGGNAQSTVNTPIDSPVSGGTGEDRPMWYWIVADEAYTELYHQYFGEFLDTVDPVAIIDAAAALIAPYVQQDPTAFYSYDAFQKGVDTLRQFCALRSESVAMQLCEGQTVETADYVDASSLALSDMGSMGMGGGFNMPAGGDFVQAEGMEPTAFGFDSSQVPEGFDPSQMGEEFDASQMPEGFDPGSFGGGNQMPGETGRENAEGSFASPGDRFREADTQSSNGWIWIVASALALVVGLIVVKKSKY